MPRPPPPAQGRRPQTQQTQQPCVSGRLARAALACAAAAAACARPAAAAAVTLGTTAGVTFGALANWGGTGVPPYTTPGQVAAAASLEAVAAVTDMQFLLSAGGNFLPQGLPGAPPRAPQGAGHRRVRLRRTHACGAGGGAAPHAAAPRCPQMRARIRARPRPARSEP
jgi:hypothetical protein